MNLPKGSTKNDKLKLAELESIRELLSKYDVQGKSVLSQTFFFSLSLANEKKLKASFFFPRSKRRKNLSQVQTHFNTKNTYPNHHTY